MIVQAAHEFPGWLHAWRGGEGAGELISHESVFWDSRTELVPEERQRAAQLAVQLLGRPDGTSSPRS